MPQHCPSVHPDAFFVLLLRPYELDDMNLRVPYQPPSFLLTMQHNQINNRLDNREDNPGVRVPYNIIDHLWVRSINLCPIPMAIRYGMKEKNRMWIRSVRLERG